MFVSRSWRPTLTDVFDCGVGDSDVMVLTDETIRCVIGGNGRLVAEDEVLRNKSMAAYKYLRASPADLPHMKREEKGSAPYHQWRERERDQRVEAEVEGFIYGRRHLDFEESARFEKR
jgi:hypothetical protein